jgi:hypothetical protein
VANSDGDAVVEWASRMTLGESKKLKKAKGLSKGGSITAHDHGEVSLEDPVTLVLTERSLRIVDRIAGETITKFMLNDMTFTSAITVNKVHIFAFIVRVNQFGSCKAFIFADRTQDGAQLQNLIDETKLSQQEMFSAGNLFIFT